MKSLKIAAAVAVFGVVMASTLVVKTPLASLQSKMPSMLQDTEQFSGSLIKGSVKELGTVNGPLDLQWTLKPMKLLTGKLGGDVEFDWLQASGNGDMAVSPSQTVHIRDTKVKSPASLLETFLPFVRFGGKMELSLAEGTASQTSYGPFLGEFIWQQASVTVGDEAKLGDLSLAMTEQDGGTHGILSSKGGDLDLKGTIDFSPAGEYTVNISAHALPSAPRSVKNALSSFAEEQSDGSYRFKNTGQISELM